MSQASAAAQLNLDMDLYDASINGREKKYTDKNIIELLKAGANPFTKVQPPEMLQIDTAFKAALQTGESTRIIPMIKRALEIRTAKYEPINLSQRIYVTPLKQMNLFQYACLMAKTDVVKKLYAYAEQTGQIQHIKHIINDEMIYADAQGNEHYEYLGPRLMQELSTSLIDDNFYLTDETTDSDAAEINQFLDKWMFCQDEQHPPSCERPIKLVWQAPMETVDVLLPHFDLTATCICNKKPITFVSLVEKMHNLAQDKKDYPEFRGLLRLLGVKIISEPENTPLGVMVRVLVGNKVAKLSTEMQLTMNFSRMLAKVRQFVAAQTTFTPALAKVNQSLQDTNAKVAGLDTIVKTHSEEIQRIDSEVKGLKIQVRDIAASLKNIAVMVQKDCRRADLLILEELNDADLMDFYTTIRDRIYKKLANIFDAVIEQTGLLTAKNVVGGVLQIASTAGVPGSGIAAVLLTYAADAASKMDAEAKAKNLKAVLHAFDAQTIIAMDVAATLAKKLRDNEVSMQVFKANKDRLIKAIVRVICDKQLGTEFKYLIKDLNAALLQHQHDQGRVLLEFSNKLKLTAMRENPATRATEGNHRGKHERSNAFQGCHFVFGKPETQVMVAKNSAGSDSSRSSPLTVRSGPG